jgi:hypothetical protein
MTIRTNESPRLPMLRASTRQASADGAVAADVDAASKVGGPARPPAPGSSTAAAAFEPGADAGSRARGVAARMLVAASALPARGLVVDVGVRAGFASIGAAPAAAGVPIAAAHDVVPPRACCRPSGHGYADAPGALRPRARVQVDMAASERALAALRERLLSVAANDDVVAHCPRVASAGSDARAVGVAIVVDVFVLCPHVLAAPEVRAFLQEPPVVVAVAAPASSFDLASLFAPLVQGAGIGLQALGGLLENPAVIGLLTPLLTAALTAALPAVAAVIVPLLPTLLPMVGQLLTGVGAGAAGHGGPSPLHDLGVAGAFAAAV